METVSKNKPETNAVPAWFGGAFTELHPQLQILHRKGGNLTGHVRLSFGSGIAGAIGRRLARKLGVPAIAGEHEFRVEIRHEAGHLYWARYFDGYGPVLSVFTPVGNYPHGHWVEKTGPATLLLTVDIIDRAWHWRLLGVRIFGLPLPLWLFPHSIAYKRTEGTEYQFHVSFSMPWLGKLLCYEGRLLAGT